MSSTFGSRRADRRFRIAAIAIDLSKSQWPRYMSDSACFSPPLLLVSSTSTEGLPEPLLSPPAVTRRSEGGRVDARGEEDQEEEEENSSDSEADEEQQGSMVRPEQQNYEPWSRPPRTFLEFRHVRLSPIAPFHSAWSSPPLPVLGYDVEGRGEPFWSSRVEPK